jgi:transcriptional regulator with XRE-family HTH domain
MAKAQKKSPAMKLLDEIVYEPLSFGHMIRTLRECKPWTQAALAHKLGISRNHLSDVERGRKLVSAERALRWARIMGGSPHQFVQLALQGELDAAGMKARVRVEAA